MAKIFIEIQDCTDCPFCKERPVPTPDSWDTISDYFCTAANYRMIEEYVDWYEHVTIPEWCPQRVKEG